jgi:hypothetical protein
VQAMQIGAYVYKYVYGCVSFVAVYEHSRWLSGKMTVYEDPCCC